MDALEAELAVLVSETEEEVVNNSGEGVALPSRYIFFSADIRTPLLFVEYPKIV